MDLGEPGEPAQRRVGLGPDTPAEFGRTEYVGQLLVKFNQAGTYDYHCEVHVGLGMVGTIVGK
ncbi:MAG: plastocyanin/azurin family copper-binding protein [Gemmatimonadales bacterium]